MDYYIKEDKTFNSISGIKHAKIELTFSDNTKLIYHVPTDNGTLLIKGSDILDNSNARFQRAAYIYERAILELPFPAGDKGPGYTVEKI